MVGASSVLAGFPSTAVPQHIVEIEAPTQSNETNQANGSEGAKNNHGHGRLSSGAIAGIVASGVVAIVLVVLALLHRRRIRRQKREDAQMGLLRIAVRLTRRTDVRLKSSITRAPCLQN